MVTAPNPIDQMGKFDQRTLSLISVVADPLNRKIMAKLASKHSPIAMNNVPTQRLEASKIQVVSRLCRLERQGLVVSERKKDGDSFYREYSISANGRVLVDSYMGNELNKFQS